MPVPGMYFPNFPPSFAPTPDTAAPPIIPNRQFMNDPLRGIGEPDVIVPQVANQGMTIPNRNFDPVNSADLNTPQALVRIPSTRAYANQQVPVISDTGNNYNNPPPAPAPNQEQDANPFGNYTDPRTRAEREIGEYQAPDKKHRLLNAIKTGLFGLATGQGFFPGLAMGLTDYPNKQKHEEDLNAREADFAREDAYKTQIYNSITGRQKEEAAATHENALDEIARSNAATAKQNADTNEQARLHPEQKSFAVPPGGSIYDPNTKTTTVVPGESAHDVAEKDKALALMLTHITDPSELSPELADYAKSRHIGVDVIAQGNKDKADKAARAGNKTSARDDKVAINVIKARIGTSAANKQQGDTLVKQEHYGAVNDTLSSSGLSKDDIKSIYDLPDSFDPNKSIDTGNPGNLGSIENKLKDIMNIPAPEPDPSNILNPNTDPAVIAWKSRTKAAKEALSKLRTNTRAAIKEATTRNVGDLQRAAEDEYYATQGKTIN